MTVIDFFISTVPNERLVGPLQLHLPTRRLFAQRDGHEGEIWIYVNTQVTFKPINSSVGTGK